MKFLFRSPLAQNLRHACEHLLRTVEALVHKSHSYRIAFERQGIESQEIPDYKVMSSENIEAINFNKITKEFLSRPDISYYMVSPLKPAGAFASLQTNGSKFRRSNPMLSSSGVIGSAVKLEGYSKPKFPTLVLPTTGSFG
ncbi:CLUMA_CG006581, isoform A [Clunio marinus]|uniref:CLUMA_CG006581, isoform A n=1 Tax=Clunio marinus TaxID=568069 RepID=A0A1J1HYG7_9DIPT|nr:CLUMA_CG006581, isoform A [Clunio marinus]